MIPVGLRAYPISTARDTSRVAGFVLPGNRVDVLMTLRGGDQKRTGGGSTVTLLQAVEILAVAQETNVPAENKMDPQKLRSVTLLVTPDQAAMLDLGQSMGTLSLSLRNPDDIGAAVPSMATVNRLRYLQTGPLNGSDGMMAPLEAELEDEPSEIRTIRGRHVGRVLVRN
jgi:pilus assembly protein CpaB